MNDYLKYRGKCKEMSEQAVKDDPSLTLVRGYYFCPVWNRDEPHWWTIRVDGSIFDPTAKQFASKGYGIYTEFDGTINCSQCGRQVAEEHTIKMGNYAVCSDACALRLVGL